MDLFVYFWPILPKAGNNFSKKGGLLLFPTNFLCVLHAKFNVDYDFSIKHDLIPSSDQLMGVHILHEKGGMIPKKRGESFCFSPNFLCVLDAKFNVDYNVVIKHDLIP